MAMTAATVGPLRVDFVPQKLLPLAGRLGMTTMPGRRGRDSLARFDRDLDVDLAYLRSSLGVRHLVSLMTATEYASSGPSLDRSRTAARSLGVAFDHYPFLEGDVPPPDAASRYLGLVTSVLEQLRRGEHVVIHGRGGRGRCGLVIGCVLVASGLEAESAIAAVEAVREGAIEAEPQRAFVRAFAREWRAQRHDLTAVVLAALTESDWRLETTRADGVVNVLLDASSATADYGVHITVLERPRLVGVVVRLPVLIAAERRHAVAALLGHLNYIGTLGAFDINLRDGDVRLRAELPVADGTLGQGAVRMALATALRRCDEALPLISKVAHAHEDPLAVL